jgi:hypothetical protein
MRFTRIDGTAVAVSVTSAQEAKAALKELRHRKRELKFLRGALAKQQRAMRPTRAKKKSKQASSGLATFLDDMRWGLSALAEQGTAAEERTRKPTPAEVAAELRRLDETLHNIEGCILQLQGKLLTRG